MHHLMALLRSQLSYVIVVTAIASSLAAQDPVKGWTTQQHTHALVLTKVQDGPAGSAIVSLTNVSGKLITAVAISSPPSTLTVRHFFDYLDQTAAGLPNGAALDLRISPEEVASNTHRLLDIDAVVFSDGTADGLQAAVAFIDAKRLGRVLETERIANLLSHIPEPPDLDALITGIGALPEGIEAALTSLKSIDTPSVALADLNGPYGADNERAFLSGVRHAREEAQWKAQKLKELYLSPEPHETLAAALHTLTQAYFEKTRIYHAQKHLLGRLPR